MKKNMSYIHFAIGLAIMVGFRFIPLGVLPNVTAVGLSVLGVFLGTIYMWSTIDPAVASLTSICMLCFSGFAPTAGVLQQCFGNPVVTQMFFLMVFMGGLTDRRLTVYIARWIMTRKFVEGKPWVFTLVMLVGTYVMSVFIGAFAPIFLFWPVLYGVFEEVGYKPGDKYPTIMLIAIVVAALVGFPVPPYMSNGLALLGNYRGLIANNFTSLATMPGVMVSNASYFIGCFTLGLVLIAAVVLVMKFVFKPDVTPLKQVTIEMLERNPLPPMNKSQKTYGVFLGIFVFVMLVPSLLPNLPVLSFLNANSLVLATVLVTALALINFDEEGPVLRFGPVMGQHFSWPTYFLCVSAILIGAVLTAESTGITPFLNTILAPIFNGMSGFTFTVVLLLVCIVLTNISNSLVIGMILQPVVLTYCATANVNPAPIITLLIFTVLLTAACTPAASPFAAMLFGNKKWLASGDVYKYSLTIVAVETVIIIALGIPFINILL